MKNAFPCNESRRGDGRTRRKKSKGKHTRRACLFTKVSLMMRIQEREKKKINKTRRRSGGMQLGWCRAAKKKKTVAVFSKSPQHLDE